MKTLIGFLVVSIASPALAHDSTMPHLHPHASSFLPDYAAMLLAAAAVTCGVIAYRVFRKG